jgi:hypothetical protein
VIARPAGRSGAAGLRRCLVPAILAGLAALPACGAGRDSAPPRVTADWAQRPTTGSDAVASLRLTAATGQPLAGARLEARAFMSHPGMAPVTAAVEEQGEGVYQARFRFTMAGDWVIRVTGSMPDGRVLDQPLDVTTVRAAQGR